MIKKLATKKYIVLGLVLLSMGAFAFQQSPYARRIRPFASTPGSCIENEIGYNMTSHILVICKNTGYVEVTAGAASTFAPSNATFITQTANSTLTNEQALASLATGILKNTTTTGVLSIAGVSDVDSILPTQTGNSGKFLTTNGTISSWATGGSGITIGTTTITSGTTTRLLYDNAGVVGEITGATSNGTALTLVAPVLGTPASGTLTNATGLPISTGVSGLGTGVATFLATPSSANLISAVTDETGTGALVFANTPTLVTPVLGTATATKITIAGSGLLLVGDNSALKNNGVQGGFHVRNQIDSAYGPISASQFLTFDGSGNLNFNINFSTLGGIETVSGGYLGFANSATQSNGGTDLRFSRLSAGVAGIGTSSNNSAGSIKALAYLTDSNCSDSAGGAACGSATAGSFVMDAAATTVVVSTTSVTANSQIFIQEDSSLGTRLSVTCNTTIARSYVITARTSGTSFTITTSATPVTNPACLSYRIVN